MYARHPLQQRTILQRVRASRGTLSGLSEQDLAVDNTTEITDQNHIGGLRFVEELARRAGIGPTSRVLDLGCGLGGSARSLASMFDCRVHGIDFSPKRCREASRLTALVGLSHLVTFSCGDFRSARVPVHMFDVLWGQSAWVHMDDKRKFIRRWSRALKDGGRIAMEDAFLKALPSGVAQHKILKQLENQWKSYLVSIQEWVNVLKTESFVISTCEDHTEQMTDHFRKLLKASRGNPDIPKEEVIAWRNAVRLSDYGLLSYNRVVAEKAD